MTAAGIEADTVIPALRPTYTLAAPMTTESMMPSTMTRSVISGRGLCEGFVALDSVVFDTVWFLVSGND